jgi:hypothetical protein
VALRNFAAAVVAVGLLGCGGSDIPDGAAANVNPDEFEAVGADSSAQDPVQLIREVFSYNGGGRDPFGSLIATTDANLRPLPEDIRVMSITFDAAYPTRSVAVIRDTTMGERYDLRVNDRIGRMLVTEIRSSEVVFLVENFGVPEPFVLSMRRREGGF